MKNPRAVWHIMALALLPFLWLGCFPEETLEWSDDGSVGLAQAEGKLYLVDGATGVITVIVEKDVTPWPGISPDGQWIVFTQERQAESLQAGLEQLTPGEAAKIRHDAEVLKNRILPAVEPLKAFPSLNDTKLEENYIAWIERYLCENADETLRKKLDEQTYQQGLKADLTYYVLQMAPKENPQEPRVLATSLRKLYRPRFSPDNKAVAYLMGTLNKEDFAHDLMLAVPERNISAALVGESVCWGCDWRDDSRALAYIETEGDNDMAIGILAEREIFNDAGELQTQETTMTDSDFFNSHNCTGKRKELAGVMHNSMAMVEYGLEGRIFFSGVSWTLPATTADEVRWNLFCYDPVTATVANILPSAVRYYATIKQDKKSETEDIHLIFSLSPDRRSLLLGPNRFAIYRLGEDKATYPVEESYAAAPGAETYDFLPAWKGNDRISCKVPQNSPLLPEGERDKEHVIIINTAGEFQSIIKAPEEPQTPTDSPPPPTP